MNYSGLIDMQNLRNFRNCLKSAKLRAFFIQIFVSLALIIFFCSPVFAAQLPRYLGSERKFRSYIYNPNEVYRYVGHYTYQGFIEFGENEKIATISMGNQTLWLFEILGNRLFLKPVGEDSSETNMTVITDKRVYHFELMAREAKGISDKNLIFVAKFFYPDDKEKNLVQFPKILPSDEPNMTNISAYNFNYQYVGESNIAPLRVFDNGTFTYFQFSKRNTEIPAIFTVDSEGFEGLVNLRVAGDYMIVERVAPQFSLRNGSDIVCIYNMELYSSGRKKVINQKNKDKKKKPALSNFDSPLVNSGLSNPAMVSPYEKPLGRSSNPSYSSSPEKSLPTSPNDSRYEMLYKPDSAK